MKKLYIYLLLILLSVSGAAHSNDLFVTDVFNYTSVFRYDGLSGAPLGNFVDPNGNLGDSAGITFGPDRNLYVGDALTGDVLRYDGITGQFIDIFASTASNPPTEPVSEYVSDLIFGPDNNLYVAVGTGSGGKIVRFDGASGNFIDDFVPYSTGLVNQSQWLAFGTDGNLYVSTSADSEVQRYDGVTGAFIDTFVTSGSGGLVSARDLAFGLDGNLYVANVVFDSEVLRYDATSGAFIDVFVPSGSGGLFNPEGIVFGPDDNLYVASAVGDKVLRYDGTTGAFIDEFVTSDNGGLDVPLYLAFAPPIPLPPTPVTIDIKPSNKPENVINLKKKNLKVAIFGSETFDALQVDHTTVKFGTFDPDAASPIRYKGQDYNHDGYSDLILTFKLSETGIVCGVTEATLTGETSTDPVIAFQGTDSFTIKGCQ